MSSKQKMCGCNQGRLPCTCKPVAENEQKMVSDSELTECQFHNNCGGWCETRRELEHNLCEHCLESHDEEMSGPAQASQHQGEPGDYLQSCKAAHDALAIVEQPQAEPVGYATLRDGRYGSWLHPTREQAESFDSTAMNGRPANSQIIPVFEHEDNGEVERLEKMVVNATNLDFQRRQEIASLKTKLAEREALLREVAESAAWGIADLRVRIEKVLSASAEPSAPVERDERAEFEQWFGSQPENLLDWNGADPYDHSKTMDAWQAWQARAALERKP